MFGVWEGAPQGGEWSPGAVGSGDVFGCVSEVAIAQAVTVLYRPREKCDRRGGCGGVSSQVLPPPRRVALKTHPFWKNFYRMAQVQCGCSCCQIKSILNSDARARGRVPLATDDVVDRIHGSKVAQS